MLVQELRGRFVFGIDLSLLEAGNFVEAIEARQGLKIACLEEIAWHNGWISPDQVKAEAQAMGKSAYAVYLWDLLRQAGHG